MRGEREETERWRKEWELRMLDKEEVREWPRKKGWEEDEEAERVL